MDPLSITTGVLALIGACATVSRTFAKVRSLGQAPALIQALNNEVSDLQLALLDINDYLEKENMTRSIIANADKITFRFCVSVLEQTREKVRESDTLLRSGILVSKTTESSKVNRIAFLRERTRLGQLQTDLRYARQRIVNLFDHFGMRSTSKLEVSLRDLRLDNIKARTDMRDGFTVLAEGQTRMEGMLTRMLETQCVPVLPFTPSRLAKAPASTYGIHESIELSVTRTRYTPLASTCACPRKRATNFLETCLGRLFIGYAAAPTFGHHRRGCAHKADIELIVCFFFPVWLLNYIISIYAQYRPFEGLTFSLSFRQTIPIDHVIWDLIDLGYIEKIKGLMCSGQITVTSSNLSGTSLLHASILCSNNDSTEFLLKAGADLFFESAGIKTPYKLAWDRILASPGTVECMDRLKSILPVPDFDELYSFSSMHKAVLGLEGCQLESAIRTSAQAIDTVDCDGRTPLSWASSRGDAQAIEMLLSQEADYNKPDTRGVTPLHYASRASKECVDLLLNKGANANARTKNLMTALHTLADRPSPILGVAEALLRSGCGINLRNSYGCTALDLAVGSNRQELAHYLIQQGADPSNRDTSGANAMCRAIRRRSHPMIELLLSTGQDHVGTLEHTGTFMHLTAELADTVTLRLLTSAGLERRDIHIKNKKGLTALQVGYQRSDTNAEWIGAFVDFLRSIDQSLPPRGRDFVRSEVSLEDSETTDDDGLGEDDAGENDGLFEDVFEDTIESLG